MKDVGPGSAMRTCASGQVSRVRVLGDRPDVRREASVACVARKRLPVYSQPFGDRSPAVTGAPIGSALCPPYGQRAVLVQQVGDLAYPGDLSACQPADRPDRWTAPRSAFRAARHRLAGDPDGFGGLPGRDHHGPVRLGVPAPGIGTVVAGVVMIVASARSHQVGPCRSRLRLVARAQSSAALIKVWRCFQAARQRASRLSVTFPAAGMPLPGAPSCGPNTSLFRKQ
jgi:hypothetical protein